MFYRTNIAALLCLSVALTDATVRMGQMGKRDLNVRDAQPECRDHYNSDDPAPEGCTNEQLLAWCVATDYPHQKSLIACYVGTEYYCGVCTLSGGIHNGPSGNENHSWPPCASLDQKEAYCRDCATSIASQCPNPKPPKHSKKPSGSTPPGNPPPENPLPANPAPPS